MSKLFADRLAWRDFEKDPSDLRMTDCLEAILARAKSQAEVAASAAKEVDSEFSPDDIERAIRSIALEIGDAQDVLDIWFKSWQKNRKGGEK